ARFVLMNVREDRTVLELSAIPADHLELADRWILSRLSQTAAAVDRSFNEFRFNDATRAIYEFVWGEFCDWYVELIKMRLYDETQPQAQQVACSIAVRVLDSVLRLLHPFMPFITEEIWQSLPMNESGVTAVKSIMLQSYPLPDSATLDTAAEAEMALLQSVIGAVRNIRGEMNVPPAKEAVLILNAEESLLPTLRTHENYIRKLGRVSAVLYQAERPALAASAVAGGVQVWMPLAGLIDVEVEKKRLEKEIARLGAQVTGLEKKLLNRDFVDRAPRKVIEKEKKKKEAFSQTLNKLQESLHWLAGR
ncbi:MAG TPA: class I tRNA ligase family protein, partial [bacterium]|nr:class I tRNA ligase family protein [bacterium]